LTIHKALNDLAGLCRQHQLPQEQLFWAVIARAGIGQHPTSVTAQRSFFVFVGEVPQSLPHQQHPLCTRPLFMQDRGRTSFLYEKRPQEELPVAFLFTNIGF